MSKTLLKAVLPTAALSAVLLLAAPASGWCWELLSPVPSVRVTIPATASQAQLEQQLRAQGYQSVRLASALPNPVYPHPELSATEDPATTPVHQGWNGTAARDGTVSYVYVTLVSGTAR